MSHNSKFFAKPPNGTQAPAKQSKLSFATKSTNAKPKAESEGEEKDVGMEDESLKADVKPEVKNEDTVKPEEIASPGKGMSFVHEG